MTATTMVLVLLLAAPRAARACQCGASYGLCALPRSGTMDAPTNVRPAFVYQGTWTSSVTVTFDGVETTAYHFDYDASQSQQMARIEFDADVPTDTEVTVVTGGGTEVTTFVVGDERDDEPPTWDGSVDVDHERFHDRNGTEWSPSDPPTGCAENVWAHYFLFGGVDDNSTDADDLLTWLEPVSIGEPVWGCNMYAEAIQGDGCVQMDDTLEDEFHRRYEVRFIDMAGNVSNPVEIGTCGCHATRKGRMGAAGALATMLPAVLSVAIRRPSRRPRTTILATPGRT